MKFDYLLALLSLQLLQCMMEGLGLVFQLQPPPSANFIQKDEVHAQVCFASLM